MRKQGSSVMREIAYTFIAMMIGGLLGYYLLNLCGVEFQSMGKANHTLMQIHSEIQELKNMQCSQDLLYRTGKFVIADDHEVMFSGNAEEMVEMYRKVAVDNIPVTHIGNFRIMEEKIIELGKE